MTYQTIRLEEAGPVATVTLDRPERMNAVIEEMYQEIQDALARCATSPSVRAVILTGAPLVRDGVVRPAFCAGADLKHHASGRRTASDQRRYIELAHATTRQLAEHPQPTIAAIGGPARGAGAEMALCCDFVFMAEEATVAFPETGLGTFVGGGVTRHLPRTVGLMRAKELVFSGRVVDGVEAVGIGLALRAFPGDRLLEEAHAFALAMASRAPLSIRLAKQHLQASGRDLETTLREEAWAILECMATEDWQEGVRAFAEKRRPVFRGR